MFRSLSLFGIAALAVAAVVASNRRNIKPKLVRPQWRNRLGLATPVPIATRLGAFPVRFSVN